MFTVEFCVRRSPSNIVADNPVTSYWLSNTDKLFVKDSNLVNRLLLNKLSYLRIGRSSVNDQISIQFKHTEAFTFQYFIKKTHQRAGLTSKPKLL